MSGDPFNLERFVAAQASVIDRVIEELTAGRKRSHWMWFIFPQLRGLGRSSAALFYGIDSLDEARAYFAHARLGARLIVCSRTVLESQASSLRAIFGAIDEVKFRSSMTLFEAAAPRGGDVFAAALERWCAGERDAHTLRLIGPSGAR